MAIKNKDQKLRFAYVGAVNTCLDFGILFLLKSLGLPTIPSNIISTSVAFCFSFFANKKYTFKTTGTDVKKELLLFIVITLFGLWVLQTLVITMISQLLTGTQLSSPVILFVSKIAAVLVSLTWNYILYSRVVFKTKSND